MPDGCISEQSCDRCRNDLDHQLEVANNRLNAHSAEIKELTVIVTKLTQLLETQAKTNETMEKRVEMLEKSLLEKDMAEAKRASEEAAKKPDKLKLILDSKAFIFFITVLGVCVLAITLSAVGQGQIKDLLPSLLGK